MFYRPNLISLLRRSTMGQHMYSVCCTIVYYCCLLSHPLTLNNYFLKDFFVERKIITKSFKKRSAPIILSSFALTDFGRDCDCGQYLLCFSPSRQHSIVNTPELIKDYVFIFLLVLFAASQCEAQRFLSCSLRVRQLKKD